MSDLLPCPFCGGNAETVTGPVPDKWGTLCECGVFSDDRCLTKTEAIAAWNTRSTAAALALPEIAALVEFATWLRDHVKDDRFVAFSDSAVAEIDAMMTAIEAAKGASNE